MFFSDDAGCVAGCAVGCAAGCAVGCAVGCTGGCAGGCAGVCSTDCVGVCDLIFSNHLNASTPSNFSNLPSGNTDKIQGTNVIFNFESDITLFLTSLLSIHTKLIGKSLDDSTNSLELFENLLYKQITFCGLEFIF